MPSSYSFNRRANMLYTRFWGFVTDSDIIKQSTSVAQDKRLQPGIRELVDLLDVERVDVSTDAIRSISETDIAHTDKFAGQKTAIVADKDAVYGLARMYQNISEAMNAPSNVKVFKSLEAARNWLDMP